MKVSARAQCARKKEGNPREDNYHGGLSDAVSAMGREDRKSRGKRGPVVLGGKQVLFRDTKVAFKVCNDRSRNKKKREKV